MYQGEVMKKVLVSVFFVIAACGLLHAAQARNMELVDVPTANTLLKGEIRADFKFSPGGGILSRLYIGIFERLYIGGAFNVNNVIGSGTVQPEIPDFTCKIRITDDEGAVPAISLGYEGQGYMNLPAKGIFLAVTKEISAGIIIQLTGAVYTDNFVHFGQDIGLGAGFAVGITRELNACAEVDGIPGYAKGRINFGIGYFFDPIEIDIGFKFGFGDGEPAQARVLKVVYITYF
jgi:hypothetical protein